MFLLTKRQFNKQERFKVREKAKLKPKHYGRINWRRSQTLEWFDGGDDYNGSLKSTVESWKEERVSRLRLQSQAQRVLNMVFRSWGRKITWRTLILWIRYGIRVWYQDKAHIIIQQKARWEGKKKRVCSLIQTFRFPLSILTQTRWAESLITVSTFHEIYYRSSIIQTSHWYLHHSHQRSKFHQKPHEN